MHNSRFHGDIFHPSNIHHDHGNHHLLSNVVYNHVLGNKAYPCSTRPLQHNPHLHYMMHSSQYRDDIFLPSNIRRGHDNLHLLSNAAYNHALGNNVRPYSILHRQRNRHLLNKLHSNQVHDDISLRDNIHPGHGSRIRPCSVAYIQVQGSRCSPCNTRWVRLRNPCQGYSFYPMRGQQKPPE